jgi:protein Mpv17
MSPIPYRFGIPQTAHPLIPVFASLIFDQTVFATIVNCYYFTMINLLEHQSLQRGIDKIRNNIVDTMLMNWRVWPAAMLLNLWLVPIQFRVLVVNMVSFAW